MGTQLSTVRMMLIHKLLRQLKTSHVKKNVTVFAEDTDIYFCTFGTVAWEKFSWKLTKRRIKFKSWWVSERFQRVWILSSLKVQSCKLYNNKYKIASTQITNTEILAFIAVSVFKLLSRKLLFIKRKDNGNC